MQSKLTLRVEDSLIKEAKILARKKGTSVSKLFSEYILRQTNEIPFNQLPPITKGMIGAIKRENMDVNEDDYRAHLEEKYL